MFSNSQNSHARVPQDRSPRYSTEIATLFSRFCAPLLWRPLLWLSLCALCGVALGGFWAGELSAGSFTSVSRENSALWNGFHAAFFGLVSALIFRRNVVFSRIFLALSTVCFFAFWGGRAVLPPANDISQLARLDPLQRTRGPVEPQIVEVRGVVANWPKRGEFSTQFPLECSAPHRGRLWIQAKANARVRVGDELQLRLHVAPLQQPSNPGERAGFWSRIGANCWARGQRIESWRTLPAANRDPLAWHVESWRKDLLIRYETAIRGGENPSPNSLESRPFPRATAQIMTAMIFGEGGLDRPLPAQVRADFRLAGLSHLLVASGTQAALLAAGFVLTLGFLGLRPAWILAISLPVLALYALVAGGAPSIWRAVLVCTLAVFALGIGRRRDGLSFWGAAVLTLLLLEPTLAWSLSFQLTFAATWGILALSPAISGVWPRDSRGALAQMAAFSLGAQWATIPVSLVHFGTLSFVGFCANFVAIPISGLLIFFGILGLFFDFFVNMNYAFARLLLDVAHSAANLSGAHLGGIGVSTPRAWLFYGVFLVAMSPMSSDFLPLLRSLTRTFWSRWGLNLSIVALFFLGVLVWRSFAQNGGTTPKIIVLDVGQGNATLLISPENRAILVNGGNTEGRADVGESVILPALAAHRIERLEAIIVTAPDARNCAALGAILREIPVGFVLDATPSSGAKARRTRAKNPELSELAAPEYAAFLREAARQKIPVVPAQSNHELRLDPMRIRALTSPKAQHGTEQKFGVVAEIGAHRALILGGLDARAQNEIAAQKSRFPSLRSEILVLGSGEENTVSPQFLAFVKPRAALISAGRFNFDKAPHPTTLRRLDNTKTEIFRTDFDGALTASCNEKACFVQPTLQLGSRE